MDCIFIFYDKWWAKQVATRKDKCRLNEGWQAWLRIAIALSRLSSLLFTSLLSQNETPKWNLAASLGWLKIEAPSKNRGSVEGFSLPLFFFMLGVFYIFVRLKRHVGLKTCWLFLGFEENKLCGFALEFHIIINFPLEKCPSDCRDEVHINVWNNNL